MKRTSTLLLCIAACLALGKADQALAGVGIIVGVAPPAPIVEVVPPHPAPGYVWRPGYWSWNGFRYVWVPGVYVVAPRPGVVWVPGRWVVRRRGWVWVGGHWR